MALSLLQTPASCSFAQSPIIFSLNESNTATLTSSSFQYVGDLYYWQGGPNASSSVADYTITKFPNTVGAGLFDLNRIINSTLTDYAQANTSNVVYFAVDFYWQYFTGTTYVTGSHLKSQTYKAVDGYGIFPETIGQQMQTTTPYWPLLTDGPATQSAFLDNRGVSGVYGGNIGATTPTKIVYTSNVGTADYTLTANVSSSGQIQQYPIAPSQSGFPLSTTGLTYFTVQPFNGAAALGLPIRYNIDCEQKYPNVRMKWKNRFGQFDWLNFYMVSRQSFTTERKTYQPTLGTWESSTLSYQNYDTANTAYIVDSKQGLSVNTFWLPESYNDIMKQLLVSDEIYWIYNESTGALRPMSIVSNNILFKTGVVDKLIQYQFEFQFGQPYKLIL
jgi:hypothetical protein